MFHASAPLTDGKLPRMNKLFLFAIILTTTIGMTQNTDPGLRPVSVLISVTDASGIPVRNLPKEDITVLDNNSVTRPLDLHAVSDAPLSLGIVLLASKTNFAKQQAAAVELVQKLIRPGKDRGFVITAGGEKPWKSSNVQWQSDPNALVAGIKSLDKLSGLPDAFQYDLSRYSGDEPGSMTRWGFETRQAAGISVFDVAWKMMMTDNHPARRVLVMFRNPWSHSPGMSEANRNYTDNKHLQLITAAQQLHVAVYTIGVDESTPLSSSAVNDLKGTYGMNQYGEASREVDRQIRLQDERLYSGGRANVERLAAETGGRAWWKTDHNFRDAVAGITNELTGQYVLTFPPAAATPGAHALKIHCAKGMHVASPNGFFVAAPPAGAK